MPNVSVFDMAGAIVKVLSIKFLYYYTVTEIPFQAVKCEKIMGTFVTIQRFSEMEQLQAALPSVHQQFSPSIPYRTSGYICNRTA